MKYTEQNKGGSQMLPKNQNKLAIRDENSGGSLQKRAYQAPKLHHDLLREYTKVTKIAYNSYEVQGTIQWPAIRHGAFGPSYPRNS
jgi:hypothetical protein